MNSRRFIALTPKSKDHGNIAGHGAASQQKRPLMSALGQERTSPVHLAMSALPPKADIERRDWHVRLVPKADLRTAANRRPLFGHLIGEREQPIRDGRSERLVELGLETTYRRESAPNRAGKASEMAAQEIDRISDPSATEEERQLRKRRLIKGPKEFRDIRKKSRED
jgi:hypothetical protein